MPKNNTLLYVGAGVAALLILPKLMHPSTAVALPIVPGAPNTLLTNPAATTATYPFLIPGAPSLPPTYTPAYYQMYIYPAMKAANPNILNPGYVMTDAEALQYLNNYTDVRQWAATALAKKYYPTLNDAARYHWKTYGVAEQRTFLLLLPGFGQPFTPAPPNPNSSGSGSLLSTLGKVATIVAAVAGPKSEQLNDQEIMILFQGAAIIKDVIPFYKNVDPVHTAKILHKLDGLLEEYTKGL